MKISERLREVRKQIDSPEKWVKKSLAVGNFNSVVSPLDSEARCWCVVGALAVVESNYPSDNTRFIGKGVKVSTATLMFLNDVAIEYADTNGLDSLDDLSGVTSLNDSPKVRHENIMEFLDLAIKRAELDPSIS